MHDDFDVDRLAEYLHLGPAQVTKLAERGKLPGRKVGGQWKFARADVHHWLEQRIGLSDAAELVEVEGVLEGRRPAESDVLELAELLPLEAIRLDLPAKTRNSVIGSMAALAAETGLLWDPDALAEAVLAREDLHPTALENGVALLHPRRPLPGILAQAFLAFGRTVQGLRFGGTTPTDLYFLILATDDRTHLRMLARLSRLLNDGAFLETLRAADSPEAVRRALRDREGSLK